MKLFRERYKLETSHKSQMNIAKFVEESWSRIHIPYFFITVAKITIKCIAL